MEILALLKKKCYNAFFIKNIDFILLADLNQVFTLYLVFPAIVLLGIYFTIRLKFVQIFRLKMGFAHLLKKDEGEGEGDISHYEAVSAVLAGNFGTGNISGMAVALSMGGPGALVWMWIMTFLGSAIQFANCLLGVKYRQKNSDGEFVGGPMYYLKKPVGILFSLCVIVAAFTVGNFAQVNSMALPLQSFGIPPWAAGCALAVCVAFVVLGGAKSVAKVSSAVVPIMALLYFGTALFIISLHVTELPAAIVTLFKSAFGEGALVGGALGFTVMKALTTGFDRAIFATDAGTGTIPILQSGAKTKHPVIDGVVSLTAPFLVMIVCTATALVLILTGAFDQGGLQSTNMVTYAYQNGIGKTAGSFVVIISLILFGYTTTIAWATCLERAIGFLVGRRWVRPIHWLYILLVPVGAILHVEVVWILADLALSSMLLLNLIGVAGLSREVILDTEAFFGVKQAA